MQDKNKGEGRRVKCTRCISLSNILTLQRNVILI